VRPSRDRPDRMRAKDSASSRRPISTSVTAWRWRIAANPMMTIKATTRTSVGDGSMANRKTLIRPRTKKEPAKIHQARRVRRSEVSGDRPNERWGWLTSGIEDGGPEARRPSPLPVPAAHRRVVLSYRSPGACQAAAPPPAVRGVVAAVALDPIEALSAAAMSSVAVRPSAGKVATPIDAPIGTGPRCSPTNALSRNASRIRSAAWSPRPHRSPAG
jgi:hypothetical protein